MKLCPEMKYLRANSAKSNQGHSWATQLLLLLFPVSPSITQFVHKS